MKLTTPDKERLTHINHIMNEIHASTNQVYEHLIDEEFEPLKKELKKSIDLLNNLLTAVEEEVQ